MDPDSHVDACIFTRLCLPILMLTEFFQKYLRNSDSAKSFIYPIFRLTGCELINCSVHLNTALELSGLQIAALAQGNV